MLRSKIPKGSVIDVAQNGDKLDFSIKKQKTVKNIRSKA
jgi:hypothetical protein